MRPRYYERRYRQLGHKIVARWPQNLLPKWQQAWSWGLGSKSDQNYYIGDPASGDTFDPTNSVLSPQISVPWSWFMLLFISDKSTFRSWLFGCKMPKNEHSSDPGCGVTFDRASWRLFYAPIGGTFFHSTWEGPSVTRTGERVYNLLVAERKQEPRTYLPLHAFVFTFLDTR